jgi:hypothetical protein
MGTQHQIFKDGHALEQGDILEGSGDAKSGHFMGRKFGEIRTAENNFSGFKGIDFIDAIDEGCFPGPVRADDRYYFPLVDFEADGIQGPNSSKVLRDFVDFKQSHDNLPEKVNELNVKFYPFPVSPVSVENARHKQNSTRVLNEKFEQQMICIQ